MNYDCNKSMTCIFVQDPRAALLLYSGANLTSGADPVSMDEDIKDIKSDFPKPDPDQMIPFKPKHVIRKCLDPIFDVLAIFTQINLLPRCESL